jgi:hypothetical protein
VIILQNVLKFLTETDLQNRLQVENVGRGPDEAGRPQAELAGHRQPRELPQEEHLRQPLQGDH